MKNQERAYVNALTAIFFWSTVATAFELGLRKLDFLQLPFLASIVALSVFGVILVVRKQFGELFRYKKKQYFQSALFGLLNPFGYYVVLLHAYYLLPAQVAQSLNYTWPLMLVLLSVPLLGQKLRWSSLIALIISFLGVLVISSQGNISELDIQEPFGVFLAAASSIIWALFWLYNVRDKREEVPKLFLCFFFGTIYLTVTVFAFSDFDIFNTQALLVGCYLGVFEMGITFLLWLQAMKFTKSTDKIGNLVYLSPFLAIVFIYFILGEEIYYTTYIGLIIIILGIVVEKVTNKKKS